jgi:hypothetical protein
VQTFLPFPDLGVSSAGLDDRRLGKQRVETFQILRALTWPDYAWKNHPAVRMWRGFVPALVEYGLENCREWVRRGHAESVAEQLLGWAGGREPGDAPRPPWFGLEQLHLSHRSALLRKDPAHYRPLLASLGYAGEPEDLPYLWPPDVFPRWPVRAGGRALRLDDAVRLLGLDAPRPGQADAALAAAGGRDVLHVARPGSGGSTTGLGRRVDALVVPAGPLPPLGRARLGLLVDASAGTPEQWRERLEALAPARSVLLVGPDSTPKARALAAEPGACARGCCAGTENRCRCRAVGVRGACRR